MAANRNLEFSKFRTLVMYPVLERDSALTSFSASVARVCRYRNLIIAITIITKFRVNPIITR